MQRFLGSLAWPAGMLGGSYFRFDPTWENGDNGGAGLKYFGMTDEERFVGGELSPADVFLLGKQGLPVAKATDDRFAALRGVSSYEIDATNNTVRLDYVTGGSALFDTVTGENQDL